MEAKDSVFSERRIGGLSAGRRFLLGEGFFFSGVFSGVSFGRVELRLPFGRDLEGC